MKATQLWLLCACASHPQPKGPPSEAGPDSGEAGLDSRLPDMRWPLRDSGDSPSPDSGDSGDSGDSAPSDTAPSDSGVEMLPWDMDSSFQQATGWK